jgi:hypothetical protein
MPAVFFVYGVYTDVNYNLSDTLASPVNIPIKQLLLQSVQRLNEWHPFH